MVPTQSSGIWEGIFFGIEKFLRMKNRVSSKMEDGGEDMGRNKEKKKNCYTLHPQNYIEVKVIRYRF